MTQAGLAFAAGLLTVAAPCVLPVLPIVLGGSLAPPARRARPAFIAAGFVAAFAIVTVLFSLVSSVLGLSADALRKGAIFALLLFGALMLWRRPFDALMARSGGVLRRVGAGGTGKAGGNAGGFVLGLTLGVVWTPCAGPVLGAILTLLATAPDPRQAAWLLACYALGAGVPMLAVAYGGQWAAERVRLVARFLPALQRLFGALVIAVALAMLFQYDILFTTWASRWLPSFSQGL